MVDMNYHNQSHQGESVILYLCYSTFQKRLRSALYRSLRLHVVNLVFIGLNYGVTQIRSTPCDGVVKGSGIRISPAFGATASRLCTLNGTAAIYAIIQRNGGILFVTTLFVKVVWDIQSSLCETIPCHQLFSI